MENEKCLDMGFLLSRSTAKNPVLFAAFVSIIMQVCFVKIVSVKRYRSTIPVNSHGLS